MQLSTTIERTVYIEKMLKDSNLCNVALNKIRYDGINYQIV